MCESNKFKKWHKIECAKYTKDYIEIEDKVNEAMRPWNLKVEYIESEEK